MVIRIIKIPFISILYLKTAITTSRIYTALSLSWSHDVVSTVVPSAHLIQATTLEFTHPTNRPNEQKNLKKIWKGTIARPATPSNRPQTTHWPPKQAYQRPALHWRFHILRSLKLAVVLHHLVQRTLLQVDLLVRFARFALGGVLDALFELWGVEGFVCWRHFLLARSLKNKLLFFFFFFLSVGVQEAERAKSVRCWFRERRLWLRLLTST